MRLASLKEFRKLVYTPDSAPAMSTLRGRIDAGKIPGGGIEGRTYGVDMQQFRAANNPHDWPLPQQYRMLRAGLVDDLATSVKSPPKERTRRPLRTRVVTEAERRLSAAHARKRKRIIRQATPAWANPVAIANFYATAQRKTEETGILHCVDHEVPLQGKTVCGLHVETNLRVITLVENSRKHNSFRE